MPHSFAGQSLGIKNHNPSFLVAEAENLKAHECLLRLMTEAVTGVCSLRSSSLRRNGGE
jgi:hypothetical protein